MKTFLHEDAWVGGFYELAMDFGRPSSLVLDDAIKAIWATRSVTGCYLRADVEPTDQPRLAPSLALLESAGHLRGLAVLPNGRQVACGTYLVRDADRGTWIGFYIPIGSLASAYDVGGYPFADADTSSEWREPLEQWLAEMGQAVFVRTPFELALIGFEVSGQDDPLDLVESRIPANRVIGYLVPSSSKLTFYPTNQWQPTQPLAS